MFLSKLNFIAMKKTSFFDRFLHVGFQFSIYWIVSMGILFLISGMEAFTVELSQIFSGIALGFLGFYHFIHLMRPLRLPPDWARVYPELGGSCYGRGKFLERAGKIFGNSSISLAIIGVFFFTEGNSSAGKITLIIACALHALFAITQSQLMPPSSYYWELVYPELMLGDDQDENTCLTTKNENS